MHSIEMATVEHTAAPTTIIRFEDFGGAREKRIERWLKRRMLSEYGDNDDTTMNNPLLRITLKFEALSREGQLELYGFAKGRILGMGVEPSIKDLLWNVLEKGSRSDDSWEDVEEFADSLIIKEKAYMKEGGLKIAEY